ncbi:MAG: serine hydrolase domain-containing protein [Henriciella sp.]
MFIKSAIRPRLEIKKVCATGWLIFSDNHRTNHIMFQKHWPGPFNWIAVIFAATLLGACAAAQNEKSGITPNSELLTALSDAFPASSALDEPGFILRITVSGEGFFEVRSGAGDIEQNRPITADTVFHIASLSKQITAAGLAHAIRDDLVSLDDPVSDWVPEAAKYGEKLTVAHLVYMTSGLTEYTNLPGPDGRPWATFHYFTTDDAIEASLAVDELQFEPGSAWQYSNINYMLLTRIISKAYNQPFSAVVHDKVFAPLGMTSSLVNDDVTTIIPNRANAYIPSVDGVLSELRNGAQIDVYDRDELVMIRRNAPHFGGSGVMTSMNDWSKWQTELLNQSEFGDEFWSLMSRRQSFDHDKTNDAFGLVHGTAHGHQTLWYSGGDIDTSTYSVTILEPEISVTCFSNNPLNSCEQMSMRAIEILADLGAL